ncbi:MAG: radical SAM protein [Acidobacteria bacterium]|nr:radical SAM protein [Acidobacteriota bacterium]
MANKNILLLEPGYRNKYPPLGLMKIAQYHGPRGKRDQIHFVKGTDPAVFFTAWDRIYITTLFSFEFPRISETIDFALKAANGQADKIFAGGIAVSLMHDRFISEPRWRGIRFIQGLLGEAPAISLQLDDFVGELYSDDISGNPIEDLVPDYDILDQIPYKYPVRDAYFAYASRGCIRKCSFCGVPKLEGDQRDTTSLSYLVNEVTKLYGEKKDLTLMDNNVVASPNFKEIIAEIRDLGFVPGAKLNRPGRPPVQRRVDFNQGVDARILAKDPMFLRELSKICIKPLRIAFDHLGLKKPYEQAIRYSHEFGLHELSNYMLYNFHDSPADLYERMRLNIDLNEELGIRIWSFPMRYQPTDRPDRGFIGAKWSRYQLRSMQIILQATHGVVSGSPSFFKRAFGENVNEFNDLLLFPHHYIFNRDWYERLEGKDQFEDFKAKFSILTESDKKELAEIISTYELKDVERLIPTFTNGKLIAILSHYRPMSTMAQQEIWERQRFIKTIEIPEEELVEDAGLDEDIPGTRPPTAISQPVQLSLV